MSKASPKQRHIQLLSWLSTFKKSTSSKPNGRSSQQASSRESRMDYNKKQGGR